MRNFDEFRAAFLILAVLYFLAACGGS